MLRRKADADADAGIGTAVVVAAVVEGGYSGLPQQQQTG